MGKTVCGLVLILLCISVPTISGAANSLAHHPSPYYYGSLIALRQQLSESTESKTTLQ